MDQRLAPDAGAGGHNSETNLEARRHRDVAGEQIRAEGLTVEPEHLDSSDPVCLVKNARLELIVCLDARVGGIVA